MTLHRYFALFSAACVFSTAAASGQCLNAAGATFPAPIYSQWFSEYRKLPGNCHVNYQAIGSGAGINQLTAGAVDFGASDMPLTDAQMAAMPVKPLHFPTVLGAVVPIYNIPGVPDDVRFTPEVLAAVFLGKIVLWNDPRIVSLNPGAVFPAQPIIAIHRADPSGTTFVLTDYLSKAVPEWKGAIGSGTTVKWNGGAAEKGSDGIAARVKQTSGAIGYVELTYALEKRLRFGVVSNAAGVFVKASIESTKAAAARASKNMPSDFRVSITNAPGPDAYPISTFTWLMVPSHINDPNKRKEVAALLRWILTKGQKECGELGYAALPKEVVTRELAQIADLR